MTSAIGIQLRKEVRALLPWWLCAAAATVATIVLAQPSGRFSELSRDYELLAASVHVLGVLALASLSIGHELTHGTLPGLLVQPIDRRKILFLKLAVLLPAVVALGAIADAMLVRQYLSASTGPGPLLIWGPVAVAVGLVPLLTVLTRKALGGVVFAIVIPGLVFAVSEWWHPLRFGAEAWWFTWHGTWIASAVGLVVLVRLFSTLQVAGDGTSRSWSGPTVASERQNAAPRHWAWLLIRKEIRLQYLTLSVSGLYIVGAALILVAQYQNPDYMGPTFYGVTSLYGGFTALLVGAMSSAEERQLGTLASQVLLPRAASRQWTIKVSVSLGLTLVLAVGLPALLMAIHRPADAFRIRDEYVVGVLLATCVAIYVSSLSSNSLWALLASLPAIVLGLFLTSYLLRPARSAVARWIPVDFQRIGELFRAERHTAGWQARMDQVNRIRWLEGDVVAWAAVAVALVMLYFAARNHRSLERNLRTIATQVTTLVLMFWTAVIASLAFARLAYNAIR